MNRRNQNKQKNPYIFSEKKANIFGVYFVKSPVFGL